MKKIIAATLFLFAVGFIAGIANASDFALIDVKAPVTSIGTFINAKDGTSSAGGLVALITHKQGETGVLGSVYNGWVPLTIGGTLGAGGLGGPSVAMGTGINLFPVAQATLYSLVNAIAKDGQLSGLKVALAPSASSATVFIGPQESLIVRDTTHYGTKFTWFVGAAIAWN